ncbi:hypothetical protein ABZY06_30035 [Streptomyces sp. NPDC006540]|jgi:hypothetical protein|uniref:hypothetical protein n=1 Tax=Streptomyces sp. NPDC006540 TaxID=3155353 RepID=UPI0033A9F73A
MMDMGDFRAGDVLSVACPFTPARVERGMTWDYISVRWPWWDIDTGSDFMRWNGIVALGVDKAPLRSTNLTSSAEAAGSHSRGGLS